PYLPSSHSSPMHKFCSFLVYPTPMLPAACPTIEFPFHPEASLHKDSRIQSRDTLVVFCHHIITCWAMRICRPVINLVAHEVTFSTASGIGGASSGICVTPVGG